jgi:hypothetical protein
MEGQKGTVITRETPFYGTMGGQQGDTGIIRNADGNFPGGRNHSFKRRKVGHTGVMVSGMLKTGESDPGGGRRKTSGYGQKSQRYPFAAESAEDGAGFPCGAERFAGDAVQTAF